MNAGKIIALLEARGIPVVVIGGIAMRLHDSPRVTQDLDLSIPSSAGDSALRALYEKGVSNGDKVPESPLETPAL